MLEIARIGAQIKKTNRPKRNIFCLPYNAVSSKSNY
jgi:hypothetical protein